MVLESSGVILYHHQCSAQGQGLHCKLRHQGCNSAQRHVFHCKLRNLGCSFLGMNRCGSFPLLSAPSLFSIWTNIKRSEKIPGAPTRRWGEWNWLTGPSGLHTEIHHEGLNISSIRIFDQIRDPEIPKAKNSYLSVNNVLWKLLVGPKIYTFTHTDTRARSHVRTQRPNL